MKVNAYDRSVVGSATIDWDRGEGMDITLHVRGVLYVNNAAGNWHYVDTGWETNAVLIDADT